MGTKNPCGFQKQFLCGLLICLLLPSGLADGCKRGCPTSESGKLKYQPGHVYDYNFDSIITVDVTGTDSDETSLKVIGQAKLFAEGNCAYTLQLDGVTVATTKEPLRKQFTQGVNKPVQFTLNSGELSPQICADSSDNSYSLNVKRAIISLLQVTEKNHETDVFGVCPTLTSVSSPIGGSETVNKIRNLNSCAYREQLPNGMLSGIVNENAGVQSTPLLTGDYSKEQKLSNGIIQNVELVEEYKFGGAAGLKSGVKAKVKTSLKLAKTGSGKAPALANGETASIIFHQPHIVPVKNINALKKALETTVNKVDGYVKSDASQDFAELIRLMRSANSDTLIELSGVAHPNKNLGRKVYLDALFRVGTSDSVKAIIRQIPKMSDMEKKIAFMSFSLVERVTKDTVGQAANLLNANAPKEAFLAVGTLVNKYCSHESCDANEVDAVSKKFTDSLRNCKPSTKKDEDRIVYILKGIRNTHRIADASVRTLIECASTDRVPRIRVAAIQAFTASSCNPSVHEKALELLKDHNEDSEIRIEAYLVLVHCPTAQVANEISEIVNSETVYQVGGFITSHLRAIRDSTDATRETARYHLQNIRVTKKFPIDPRRFSFNSELSYAVESLGIGASADYNLIFSQTGFLPRSGKLNLTSELFGRNFNLLEVSARQENLEHILEYYFGPKGFLRQDPQEILNSIQGSSGVAGRSKRSISDDTHKFAKNYKTYGNKQTDEMNLDVSLRLFGSEFFFLSLGDNIPSNFEDMTKTVADVLQKANSGVKNFQKEFECHSLFLDLRFIYPTGIGFPLELSAQGFSAMKIDAAAEVDVDSVLGNVKNSKYRLKFVPSVDVSVNGYLGVDALVLGAGLKVTTSLHSATGGDTRLELVNNANGFNLDIELPREKLQLIELHHNVQFQINQQDKPMKLVQLKNHKKKSQPQENCFDQLQLFGLTVCYKAAVPDYTPETSFQLAGPAYLDLSLISEKKISIKGSHEQNPEKQSWKLLFDTPGSQKSHLTTLTFDLGVKPKLFARASFDHPERHLAIEGGLQKDDSEVLIYAEHEIDKEKTVHKVGFKKNGNEYKPILEVHNGSGSKNDIAGYKADGSVLAEKSGDNTRYNFKQLRLIRPNNEQIVLNGWVDLTSSSYNSELSVGCSKETYNIKSHCSFDPQKGHSLGAFVTNSKKPDVTNGGSIFLKIGDKHFKHELIIEVAQHRVQLENELQYDKNDKNEFTYSKFSNELSVKQAGKEIAMVEVDGEVSPNLVNYEIEVGAKDKKAELKFKLGKNQRSAGDYDLAVNGKINKHFIDIKAKADAKGSKLVIDNSVVTSWGTQINTQGEVGQRFTQYDSFVNLHGTVVLTAKDKPSTWNLKVIGLPDKATSEFKLSRDNAELVAFNGELTRPVDKATVGKINLQLKDFVSKGDFKLNKNGKGDLSLLMHYKKANRKVKVDSKFTIAAPKYDVETTLTFDTEKKLYYKTENIVDRTKFVTKNVVELGTEKVTFDANGATKGEWRLNGEIDGKFELTIPNGRKFDGLFNRKVNTVAKTGLSHGTMSYVINDILPSSEKRSLAINSKIEKLNLKLREFSAESKALYTAFNGKKFDVQVIVIHLPKGHFNTIEYSVVARDDNTNTPMDFHFIVDEYCSKHAIFHVSGKYGNLIDGKVNGKYNVGERGQPGKYELQANINAPNTAYKTYTLNTSGKLLRPEVENGLHEAEIHFDQNAGDNSFKFDSSIKGNQNHGSYKVSLDSPKYPLKIDGSYSNEKKDEKNLKYQYGVNWSSGDKFANNNFEFSLTESGEHEESANLHYTLASSFDSVKNLDIGLKLKKSEGEIYSASTQIQHNDLTYKGNSVLFGSDHRKGLEFTIIFPDYTSKFSSIFELLGEKKGKLTTDVENIAAIDLHLLAEMEFQNFENYNVNVELDSPKLKANKVHLQVNPQTNTAGKGIQFSLTNAKGDILAGTATYIVKKEKNKVMLEGQGQIQLYQKPYNANFKLVRQIYDLDADKEIGYSYTFNGTFGPKNAVSTLKLTNKNFHAKISTCEEKKQCTNIEVQSVITSDPQIITTFQHKLMVLIDLRELGYPHEFELQSKTSRSGLLVEHEIEANIISTSNNKYQFLANIKPNLNKIQIKLPKREILLESAVQVPDTLFGHYESSVAFYFDKLNKPNDKTLLKFIADVSGVKSTAINGQGSLKFQHPTIRPLSISGHFDANKDKHIIDTNIVFDIFKKPEQKIIASSKLSGLDSSNRGFNVTAENILKSSGLGFEYELSGHSALSLERYEFSSAGILQSAASGLKLSSYAHASRDSFEIIVQSLDEQILVVNGAFNRDQYKSKIDSKLQILGSKPVNFVSEIEPSRLAFSLKRNGLLDVSGELKLSKEAKFVVIGSGKQLYNGRIALDPNHFLATTYETNDEDVKSFLKNVEHEVSEDTKQARQNIEQRFQKVRDVITKQIELSKDSAPNFNALKENYENHLNEVVKELENDPGLSKLIETLRKAYKQAVGFTSDLIKTVSQSYEKLHKSVIGLTTEIQTIFKDTILPAWEEFSKKIASILGEFYVEAVKILSVSFERSLKALKSFEGDLKNLGKPLADLLKPIGEIIQSLIKTMAEEWEQLIVELRDNWSKIPSFDELSAKIKENLSQLKTVDEFLVVLRDAFDQLQVYVMLPESKEFLSKLYTYIENKLKNRPVNDSEALQELITTFIHVVQSFIANQGSDLDFRPTGGYFSAVPITLNDFGKLPTWISLRLSPINFLRNENWNDVKGMLSAVRPPYDLLPPYNLKGHIADGQHIFTFDGRHMTFPGSCKYILAQDYRDQNFTVVANLKDGNLKSITLVDKENFMEIVDSGALKLNGKPSEYPIHKSGIHAWRKYYTATLRSEYGVQVTCTLDLKICHVTVDGFYTSKTRGLLGNGNAEPFDDYTVPDGTIKENYAEFGNSYGIGSCKPVAAEDHTGHSHDETCSDLFGFDSPLLLGYLFHDKNLYREACDHAVEKASNNQEAACNIALAYASAARMDNLPVSIPPQCVKCNNVGEKKRDFGDEFSVKIPTNKADIIFVVDTAASKSVLSDLVTPLIINVGNELKTRGITDVNIAVIAFHPEQKYPALLTSNGGKLNYNGKLSDVQLDGPRVDKLFDVGVEKINIILKYIQAIENGIDIQPDENAFRLALEYPFRSNAAKSIIAVRSDGLEYGNMLKFARAHVANALTQLEGIALNVIGPVKDLSLDGLPTEKIVGFNSRVVATVEGKDAKKRPKLKYGQDMGIDFVINDGGWVFASENFEKASNKNAFTNQVVVTVADQLFKTDIQSDCLCLAAYGLHGREFCVVKSTNFVPNKKVKA